jgi:LysR family transcriptional regulator, glycine cleavage system transcriptional activator
MKSQYDFYLVAPAPHFKYQKVMKFKRWVEDEVKVIDSSWNAYLKANSDMEEVKV